MANVTTTDNTTISLNEQNIKTIAQEVYKLLADEGKRLDVVFDNDSHGDLDFQNNDSEVLVYEKETRKFRGLDISALKQLYSQITDTPSYSEVYSREYTDAQLNEINATLQKGEKQLGTLDSKLTDAVAELIKRMQGTSANYDNHNDIIKTEWFTGANAVERMNEYLDGLHTTSGDNTAVPHHIVCLHLQGTSILVFNRVDGYATDSWTQIAIGAMLNPQGLLINGADILARQHNNDAWSNWGPVDSVKTLASKTELSETSAELVKRMRGTSENYDCYHDIIKTVSFEGGEELKKLNDYLDSLHSSDSSADIPRHIVCAHIFGSPVLVMNRVNAYNVDYWTQIAFGVSKNSEGKIELGYDILCRTHDKDNGWSAWTKVNGVESKQDKLISEQNIKTIDGQSVLGSGDLAINKRVVEMEIGSDTDEWSDVVMAHALVFCSNQLPATNYLGITEGVRRIRSFSYMVADHRGSVPAQGNFYMCIARKEGSNWIVKGCSTNAVNIFNAPLNTYVTFYFNDVELSASGSSYGICAMITPEKRSVGYNLGTTSNSWEIIRPRVKMGLTQTTNKCIGEYGSWNWNAQVVHRIVFAEEMPRLPLNATDNNVISVNNGTSSFSPLNIKTVNGQSLLGSGNLVIGGRYEVIIQDSERGIFFTNETYESLLEKHQSANKLTFALPNGTMTGIYSIVFPADGLGKPYFSVVFNSGDETKEYALYVDNTAKKLRDGNSEGSFLITFNRDEYDHTSADKTIAQVIDAAQKGMSLKVKLVLAPEVSGSSKIATTMFTANCSLEHIYPASTSEDVDGNVPATIGDIYLYAYAQVHDTIYEVSLGNNYCNCRMINIQ